MHAISRCFEMAFAAAVFGLASLLFPVWIISTLAWLFAVAAGVYLLIWIAVGGAET